MNNLEARRTHQRENKIYNPNINSVKSDRIKSEGKEEI